MISNQYLSTIQLQIYRQEWMSPLFKDYNTRTDCLSLHQVMNPVVSLHLVYEVTLLLLLVYVVWVGGEEAGIERG